MSTHRAIVVAVALAAGAPAAHATPPPLPDIRDAWDAALNAAAEDLARCSALGTARHVYGDVVVRLDTAWRWTASPSRSLGTHGSLIAACVRRAVAKHFEPTATIYEDLTYAAVIGAPTMLLPPATTMLPLWLRATTATGDDARQAMAALRKLIPPDYALTKDACLQTARESARRVEPEWTAALGALVPRLWQDLLQRELHDLVQVSIWVDWVGAGAFVTWSPRGWCLRPFGPERQQALRAQLDTIGTGWVGAFTEVLLHPRVELPRDQRYTAVATQRGRICALTIAGGVVCVGPADPPLPPPPGPVVSLALGDHFACGLDAQGLARCWGSMIAPPPGPFRQLAAGRQRVCGLRFSGAVECWAYGAIVSPPPFADFVSVATSRDTCGLRRDGSVACWGGSESEPSPPGRFTAFAMADANVCGVRFDGTAGCWTGKRQPVEPRTPERFKDVAVGYGQLCGRRADNTVACSTPDAPRGLVPPPAAKLVQIAGDGETFCGVREDGGIDCWGDPWPGRALAGEPARMLTFRQFLSDLAARIGPPVLEPDAALGGRVVDEAGRPLAGAEVMLCRGDQPFGTVIWRARTTPGTLSELARAAAATPSATSPGSYVIVTTGADGRWAARLPPHPSYVLPLRAVITAPRREIVERSEQQLWLGSMRADIPLRPASSLDVEPICDGIPCDGEITVSAGRHEGFRGRHIERLVPATYTVDVSAGRNVRGERRGTVVVDVTYTPAALRVAVALHAPGTGTSIRGIVSPPGGSSRRVTARCGDSDDAVYRSAQTDASGEFELRDVGPPPCFVDVDGLRSVTQRVETVPAEGIELRQN